MASSSPDPGAPAAESGALGTAALLLFIVALGAVTLRYHGLQHDAQVYVVQALAKLDPGIYMGDLFLRYGSQDEFTLFSNFTALWIRALGIDHGAAALTAASLALWYVAAWLLVRKLAGAAQAWLAAGLLVVVPGFYGAAEVFQVTERFLSARLPAEALCLFGLAAVVARRHALAAFLFGTAFLTHPLMTVPAVCLAVCAEMEGRHRLLTPRNICVVLLAGVLSAGTLLGGSEPLMTGDWLAAVRARSDFLFLDTWRLADWQNVVTAGATLLVASRALQGADARRVARAAFAIAFIGLVAAACASWIVPVKVLIQAQTWRWTWLATCLAIALLPATLLQLAAGGHGTRRLVAALLASGWILGSADRSDTVMIVSSMLSSVAACAVSFASGDERLLSGRVAGLAAWLVAGVSGLWLVSLVATELSVTVDLGGDRPWMQKVTGVVGLPAFAALVVFAAWHVAAGRRATRGAWTVVVLGALLLAGAAPKAWSTWSDQRFGEAARGEFAAWRSIVRRDAEVFWPSNLQATWFALGRRSYLTVSQTGGIVFSRRTTEEARRRAAMLADVVPPGMWFNETTREDASTLLGSRADVAAACAVGEIDFVVTDRDVGTSVASVVWPMPGQRAHLHDCRNYRQAGPG